MLDILMVYISLIKVILKGAIGQFIGSLFLQGSTVITNVLVARTVGAHLYGKYSLVLTALLTLAAFAQSSIGYTTTKHLPYLSEKNKDEAGSLLGLLTIIAFTLPLLMSMGIWFYSDEVSFFLGGDRTLSSELKLGSIFLFFTSYTNFQLGLLSGLKAFYSSALSGVISSVIAVIILPTGAFFGGLVGALFGLSVYSILRFLVYGQFVAKELSLMNINISFKNIHKLKNKLFGNFILPVALSAYSYLSSLLVVNAYLVRQVGYEEMGIFSSLITMRLVVLFIPQAVNIVFLSLINRENTESRRLYLIGVLIQVFTCVIGVFIIIQLAPFILKAFGKDFVIEDGIVRLFMVSAIFEAVTLALVQILQSRNFTWRVFFTINLPRDVLFVVSTMTLIPVAGIKGVVVGYNISWAVSLVISLLYIYLISNKLNHGAGLDS